MNVVLIALVVCAAVAVQRGVAKPTERYGRDEGLETKAITPPHWNYRSSEGRGNAPRGVRVARSDRGAYTDRPLSHRGIDNTRDLSTRDCVNGKFVTKPTVPRYRYLCYGTRENPKDGLVDAVPENGPLPVNKPSKFVFN